MNRPHLLATAILALGIGAGFLISKDAISSNEASNDSSSPKTPAQELELPLSREKKLGTRERSKRDLLEELISIKGEQLVKFNSEKAYRDALARLGQSGAKLLGQMDRFRTLRLSTNDLDRLKNWIGEDGQQFSNYLVSLPLIPDTNGQFASGSSFGNNALEFLGITGDNSSWGDGVTIAIVDTAVQSHLALNGDNVSTITLQDAPVITDIHGHGTAVASIISGSHPSMTGVAPGAKILSVPVADSSGNSNSFLLAEGITAAVNNDANIINVSMGSYGDSIIVQEAIAYAIENGVAVVASVGNEGFNQAAFPAGNQGVISVGSIDASGSHMSFSNTSDTLSITAPGYGVLAAWPSELGDSAISFTGTSASAPFVSGTIAAVMSQSEVPLTAMQAWDIVQNYTNESGAPGADSFYGNGLLNVGQAIQRDTSGIYDIAVAQPYYDADTNMLQITVENRGTESFGNGELTINAGDANYPLAIPSIEANESQLYEIPIGSSNFNTDGSLSIGLQTTTNSNNIDALPSNNQRRDILLSPTD